jgi:glycosyltransferase involved in cell wall biosynthesis
VDARLRHSGQGDTGGIATLLVHLGDALLRQGPVGRVITLSGSAGHGSALTSELADLAAEEAIPEGLDRPGHHYVRIPLRGPSTGAATAWPRWVEARRGIRRVLRAAGRVDVVHLRMADVGSMVAAEVAAELGIPVVLTVAPDPQALVAAREAEGTLTRAAFGAADSVEHLWFRDRLLRRLAEQAEHLVLFPRPDVERSITHLVGLDMAARAGRVLVVGEGIDVRALERVAKEVRGELSRSPATAAALDDLDDGLAQLPADRRSLPLAVSVGRLTPVKGMADFVSSWLSDPALRCRCNLLVIGGDLDDPSPEEAAELARIHGLLAAADANGAAGADADDGAHALASAGVVLAGHRPNATTTTWLAAAQRGIPGTSAPGGVYVCASLKEEFGIAILEAMGVGLVVVAPDGGGPATYVEHGVTGILTDPTHREALATDVGRALDLASSPSAELGALRSRAVVRERFGIDRMADALAEVYVRVASEHVDEPGPVGAIR